MYTIEKSSTTREAETVRTKLLSTPEEKTSGWELERERRLIPWKI
jgi:hypothetical protein